ncbi:MAG: hypothetical protein ABL958_22010 [Bdellovibrionia bacterium]
MSRSGQAVTEYVLVLVMAILIFFAAGGFLRQFNASFATFVRNYYGEYLQCLLETGELPKLGYEGAESGCDDEFQPFTLAEGRPQFVPPRGYTPPGGGGDEGGGGGKDPTQTPPVAQGEGGGSGGSESGGGGGSTTISAGPQLLDRDSGRTRRVPLSPIDTGKKDSNGMYKKGEGGLIAGVDSDRVGRPQFVPVETDEEVTANGVVKTTKSDGGGSTDLAPRRVPADVVTVKKKIQEEEGWTLPDFLRWLLIAAIVIVMLVVFGGQALQISNGGDD